MCVKYGLLCLVLVTSSYCGNSCNINEQYSNCGNRCNEQCSSSYNSYNWYKNGYYRNRNINCQNSCTSGCFCLSGYSRNQQGTCVPASQCNSNYGTYNYYGPSTVSSISYNNGGCGFKEEYKCSNRCMEKCPALRVLSNCPQACRYACWCRGNLSRDANGNCIRSFRCPTVYG